jgi:hypothetical protein
MGQNGSKRHFAEKIWRMPQKIRNFADVKGKE